MPLGGGNASRQTPEPSPSPPTLRHDPKLSAVQLAPNSIPFLGYML